MQIFFFSFDEIPSFKGSSTHILSGLREVIKRHTVSLFSLGETVIPSAYNFNHISWSIKEENYLKRALAFRCKVSEAIANNKPNLLHFRGIWEGLPCVRSGIKCIYEVNALPSIELKETYPEISDSFIQRIRLEERECLEKARLIITPSDIIAQCLIHEHQIERHRIKILPNGHDLYLQNPKLSKTQHSGPLALIYLGTLHPWQGLLWSLRFLKELEGQIEMSIFGPIHKQWTPYLEKRIKKFELKNMVKVCGPLMRPAFHSELQRFDIGFAPFLKTNRNIRQGAHPVKVLDYLSHGLPVLSSDIPMASQVVTHNESGLLFKPQGHKELLEALARLINDRRLVQNLSEGAINRAKLLPDWSHYSHELCDHYESLIFPKETIFL